MPAPSGGAGVLRRSAPLVVATTILGVASYAVNVFLGRHLGPAEYGVLGSSRR